jgi:tryptophan 2,3-dioxygenase
MPVRLTVLAMSEPSGDVRSWPDPTAGAAGEGSRAFGEEGARLTYGSYLRLPDLLTAQVLESDPPAHDELLFITIHQVYELWFKQLLHEVEAARDAMLDGRLWWARHLLKRVVVIEGVLVHQIDVLETMTPQDFLEFRHRLAPASGFLARFRGLTDVERGRLERRLAEPTLWDAYVGVLAASGLDVADDAAVRRSLLAVARDRERHGDAWELGEALLEHDERQAAWRARHVTMVERQIGTKSGTGGSSGAPYLRSRLSLQFYPLLWELRGAL